jgi:hypothetical protein
MFSQYMDGMFTPLSEPPQQKAKPLTSDKKTQNPLKSNALLGELSDTISQLVGGIGKHFSLSQLDTGDILLVLIILFLFLEGDNLELVITLGLMLLLGFNDD